MLPKRTFGNEIYQLEITESSSFSKFLIFNIDCIFVFSFPWFDICLSASVTTIQ